MPGGNGAVIRSPTPPMAHPLPVRSPRRPGDAAHVGDDGIPAALTERPLDTDPLVEPAGPAWDSAGARQLPAPAPVPDR